MSDSKLTIVGWLVVAVLGTILFTMLSNPGHHSRNNKKTLDRYSALTEDRSTNCDKKNAAQQKAEQHKEVAPVSAPVETHTEKSANIETPKAESPKVDANPASDELPVSMFAIGNAPANIEIPHYANGVYTLTSVQFGKLNPKCSLTDDDTILMPVKNIATMQIKRDQEIRLKANIEKGEAEYVMFTYRKKIYEIGVSGARKHEAKVYLYERPHVGKNRWFPSTFCDNPDRAGLKMYFGKSFYSRMVYASNHKLTGDGNEYLVIYRNDNGNVCIAFKHK